MKKCLRSILIVLSALLMTIAPGLDLAIEKNARPDGLDLFGYVYQLIARTFASLDDNLIAAAFMLAGCVWLCSRFLLQKPARTGVGGHVLCALLSVMMLLSTAVRTQGTVRVLWANAFQLAKAGLFAVGMHLLLLCLLRALHEGLCALKRMEVGDALARVDRHMTFGKLFAVLALAWLPHLLVRYPGVLMWDSYMQIKQFMGEAERWSSHPPFGTLLYGSVAWLGQTVGNRNLVYFAFTLAQCAAYIAVLAGSLCAMRRQRTDVRFRLGALAVYALSPCFVGWATVISKDTTYQIALLLLMLEAYVFLGERECFFTGARHLVLTGASALVMALSRHNGLPVAAAVLAVMLCMQLRAKQRKQLAALAACAVIALGAAQATDAVIANALQVKERYNQDVMSLPFQQTARVASLYDAQMPQEEREIIDRVLNYEYSRDNYLDWYADPVKDSYRQSATAQDRAAYWQVWLKQLKRWPADYADATLKMNGVLFDLQDNRPMYICFTDMALHSYVYPYSFNDMTMYDREALVPLDSAQRALTEWYTDFCKLPFVGMAGSMSFHVVLMLMCAYLCVAKRHAGALLIWLPALITFAICLCSPVVYLRYALPIIGLAPLGLAAMICRRNEE